MFTVLLSTSAATGALVGFAFGVAGLLVRAATGSSLAAGSALVAVALLIVVAVAFDTVHARNGRLGPPAVQRQVPREWSQIFGPVTVAGLYGARLGVAPLTMLSTWLWWAAMIGSMLIEPWAAALVGATFGAVRVLVMAVVAPRLSRSGPTASRSLRRGGRRAWFALDFSAVVGILVMALVASACVAGGGDVEVVTDTAPPGDESGQLAGAGPNDEESEPTEGATVDAGPNDEETEVTTVPEENGNASSTSAPADEPSEDPTTADDPSVALTESDPAQLEAVLISSVAYFNTLDEPGADTFLDLEAAAQRQPDPTEERPLLETRRYLGGWTRAFRNDTQDVVIAQVYEFATATDAAFYLEDGLITLTGYGVDLFDIEGLEGVRGFRAEGEDEIGPIVSHGLTFTEGRRWYLLTLTGDSATATADILLAATRDQIERATTG